MVHRCPNRSCTDHAICVSFSYQSHNVTRYDFLRDSTGLVPATQPLMWTCTLRQTPLASILLRFKLIECVGGVLHLYLRVM